VRALDRPGCPVRPASQPASPGQLSRDHVIRRGLFGDEKTASDHVITRELAGAGWLAGRTGHPGRSSART